MKFLITCTMLLGSLAAATITDEIRGLEAANRGVLGGVTLLPDDYRERAANTAEHIRGYSDVLHRDVQGDNDDFLRVAAAREVLTHIFDNIERDVQQIQANRGWQELNAQERQQIELVRARRTPLDELDSALYALYRRIRP